MLGGGTLAIVAAVAVIVAIAINQDSSSVDPDDVITANVNAMGPETALVTMVVFGDFQ